MAMGKKLSKVDGAACRRHWRQGAPGVCPLCLRERLSRLSTSASLPSVVARGEAASPSSSCSDSEASTGASSGSASPGFHQEIKRAARPSLLMRHERVVAVDGDEVVGVVMRRRRERPTTSFWTKLLRVATGGKKAVDGCSLAHSKTIDAADKSSAATKWIIF